MSVDLTFWKYQDGVYLDHEAVYQTACCEGGAVEGLELLPLEDILKGVAEAFQDWTAVGPLHYEKPGRGSFEISAGPQAVRFDCYSMEQADMKRFSPAMAAFGCPLYDPQLGVRFDKLSAFLVGEAGEYQALAEETLSRRFPRLEVSARTVTWEEYTRLSKDLKQIHYNAVIHRGKAQTKVTSFLRFGRAWANRPCQCKTARLADPEEARRVLGDLLVNSIGRAADDLFERTCYQ